MKKQATNNGFIITYQHDGDFNVESYIDSSIYDINLITKIMVKGSIIHIIHNKKITQVIDIKTNKIRIFNHECKTYSNIDTQQDNKKLSIHHISRGHRIDQKNNYKRRSATLIINDESFPIWTLEDSSIPASVVSAIWKLLIPGIDTRNIGLPAEVTLSTKDHFSSMQIIQIESGCKQLSFNPPTDYTEDLRQVEVSQEITPNDYSYQQAVADYDFTAQNYFLHSNDPDAAFMIDQEFLDRLRIIANKVTSTISSFKSKDNGTSVNIIFDWWDQLRQHLDFKSPNDESITDDVIDVIYLLLLYLEVYEGNRLPMVTTDENGIRTEGLNSAERLKYSEISNIADKKARISAFLIASETKNGEEEKVFPLDLRLRLGKILFEEITKPNSIEVTDSVIKKDLDIATLWLRDFDINIEANNKGIIKKLQFNDGKIRVHLALDRIAIKFRYSTVTNSSTLSVICNFLTLGACLLAQNHSGYINANVSNIVLVFDIIPHKKNSKIEFSSMIDEQTTSLNINLLLSGVLPSFTNTISPVVKNLVLDSILPELGTGITRALGASFLRWPDNFHAINGPELFAESALFSAENGVLGANVQYDSSLPTSISSSAINPNKADPLAYIVTSRYLTAWLRSIIPDITATKRLPINNLLSSLGVSLPDPKTLDRATDITSGIDLGADFENEINDALSHFDSCSEPLAVPADEFKNVLELTRSLPTVQIPPEGESNYVGEVILQYHFNISAKKTIYKATPQLTQEPCEQISKGPRGPVPDPLPVFSNDHIRFHDKNKFISNPAKNNFAYSPKDPANEFLSPLESFDRDNIRDFSCPPPHCEWSSRPYVSTLKTYLSAKVQIKAKILIGFNNQFISVWIPELQIGFIEKEKDDLNIKITSLNTSGSLRDVSENDIKNAITKRCLDDVWNIISNLTSAPQTNVELIPLIVTLILKNDNKINKHAIDELFKLFKYKQALEDSKLKYYSDGESFVYWPITFLENFSQNIK